MKLRIMKLRVTNSKGIEDDALLETVKMHIKVCEKLYNPKYVDPKSKDKYYFIGDADKSDFFYFSTIKKETTIGTREVDNKTVSISKGKADTDDLARFGIDFRNNLICCILKGHFGIRQFKDSLKNIIYSSLDISGYELHFDEVSSQPVSFTFDSIVEQMKNLKLKSALLDVSFPSDELTAFTGLNEKFILENKLNNPLTDISSISEKIKSYKDEECYINLKLEDLIGHPMTLSTVPKFGLSFTIPDTSDHMAGFIEEYKIAVDDYIKLYI